MIQFLFYYFVRLVGRSFVRSSSYFFLILRIEPFILFARCCFGGSADLTLLFAFVSHGRVRACARLFVYVDLIVASFSKYNLAVVYCVLFVDYDSPIEMKLQIVESVSVASVSIVANVNYFFSSIIFRFHFWTGFYFFCNFFSSVANRNAATANTRDA